MSTNFTLGTEFFKKGTPVGASATNYLLSNPNELVSAIRNMTEVEGTKINYIKNVFVINDITVEEITTDNVQAAIRQFANPLFEKDAIVLARVNYSGVSTTEGRKHFSCFNLYNLTDDILDFSYPEDARKFGDCEIFIYMNNMGRKFINDLFYIRTQKVICLANGKARLEYTNYNANNISTAPDGIYAAFKTMDLAQMLNENSFITYITNVYTDGDSDEFETFYDMEAIIASIDKGQLIVSEVDRKYLPYALDLGFVSLSNDGKSKTLRIVYTNKSGKAYTQTI